MVALFGTTVVILFIGVLVIHEINLIINKQEK